MRSAWRKIIREVLIERTRTMLVVLAISVGIAAFCAVMSSFAVLTRELNKGYLATNPASAVVLTDRGDANLIRAILANPAVAAAEPRRVVSGRIKVGPIEWRPLLLFAVDDYANIRVSTLVHEQGAWPPGRGEVLIERDAFQVAKTSIGQTVTVRTLDGGERSLTVMGRVHDVGRAQARMEQVVYGYIASATLQYLGEEPYLDRINILVTQNRFDEAHIGAVAEEVRRTIEAAGHPVYRLEIPKPGKHPHADIMALLLLIMAGFGLLVLLLSCVLIVNLITAILASQVRQIGVMKAVGATPRQIAQIYHAKVLLLAVAALAIGVPVGLVGAQALCRYLALFLNFNITSFSVPVRVLLLVAIVGIAAPLWAASGPISRGTNITIRAALADFGARKESFGTTWIERRLTNVGGFGPVLLAVRNSFRNRARLERTVVTLAFSGLFFMSALNVRSSMVATLDKLFSSKRYDLEIGLAGMPSYVNVQRAVAGLPDIARAEGWVAAQGRLLKTPISAAGTSSSTDQSPAIREGTAGDSFGLFAIPPETSMMRFEMVEGRTLSASDTDSMIVNNSLAADPHFRVGNQVTLQIGSSVRTLFVIGRFREPFSSPTAYLPTNALEDARDGRVNDVRLALATSGSDSLGRMNLQLERNLEQYGIRTSNSMGKSDRRRGLDEHMRMIYAFLVIMAVALAVVGVLGLSATMGLNVAERRREMGIMRTLGATPRLLALLVVAESTAIALMSWGIATVLGWPVSKLIANGAAMHLIRTPLDFAFDVRGIIIWLALSLMIGAAASLGAAWSASQRSVREAVAYE